ncbi:MAG: hypothetical protein U9N49_00220 [Campylobacterota bacterium]|nr:hypothetical protein [Campylobacterota bacterium]
MKKILLLVSIFSLSLFGATTKDFKFLVKQEAKIKNVYYDKGFKKLTIQMNNDGTNRNGYGEYIGLVLNEKGLSKEVDIIFCKDTKISLKNIKNGQGKYFCKVRKTSKGTYLGQKFSW